MNHAEIRPRSRSGAGQWPACSKAQAIHLPLDEGDRPRLRPARPQLQPYDNPGYAGGMFNRLLGRKQQPNPEPGPQFAMLMLRSGKGLKEQNIAAAWKALFPNLPALKPTEVEKDDKGAVASFSTDGRTLLLA